MTLLRRVLKIQAALWAVVGLLCLVAPGSVVDRLSEGVGSSAGTDALVRVLGVAAMVLAMLMVLVAQRADTWWWAWAFAVLETGVATVAVLQAALGVPEGEPTAAWWLLGTASATFAVLDLVALARAGQERPFA
jgi:hypothetical protein